MAVFSTARKDLVVAVLAAAGAVGALTACSSNEATYRPQPQSSGSHSCGGSSYSQPRSQPTYSQPSATTPQPSKPSGQMACGKGKCG